MDLTALLKELGVDLAAHAGSDLAVRTPIDGSSTGNNPAAAPTSMVAR